MKHSSLFLLYAFALMVTSCLQPLQAAPLTWFPGPAFGAPVSGAATIVARDKSNLIIGGDSYYSVESLAATNLYWNYLPALYSIQIAPGALETGDFIVVYGGTDGTTSLNTVTAYDPTGDTTPTLSPMSVPRSYLGYASDANGRGYAIGGLDDTGQPLASAERYNPGSDSWSAIASLPTTLYNFPAVFDHTNLIYIFGGYTDSLSGVESAAAYRYSVKSNTWTAIAPMPVAVAGAAAALGVDGKIYVAGGLSGGIAQSAVQVYDPAANSWTLSTPLPEALSGSAMSVDSLGRLLIVGGMDINGNDVADVWRSQEFDLPDSPPVITQYPATSATYQSPYSSSFSATGNPPPVYSLVSGPPNMVVDYYTGTITWTPQTLDQIGAIPVTVQAANYAGTSNWSFTITVPNPPPTLLTNLTVVSTTESSVTLAWSPEGPAAGPVTYSVWLRHVAHSPRGSGVTIWYTQIGGSTTQPTITISGLAAGLVQTYYIIATGSGGSSPYAAVSATTLSAPPPANLRVAGLTSTTITLAWDAPVGQIPVASYEVLGWYNGIAAQYPLAYANITGTTITITGLAPGTAMLWGVSERDTAGNMSAYDYLPSLVVNPQPASPYLTITAPPAGGSFQFTASEAGPALQTIIIQATTNPADPSSWTQIGSFLPATNPFVFTDTNAGQFKSRFYRVVAP